MIPQEQLTPQSGYVSHDKVLGFLAGLCLETKHQREFDMCFLELLAYTTFVRQPGLPS